MPKPRPWTAHEVLTLEAHYPSASRAAVMVMLRPRTWCSIVHKAKDLGLKRSAPTLRGKRPKKYPPEVLADVKRVAEYRRPYLKARAQFYAEWRHRLSKDEVRYLINRYAS